MVLVMDTDFDMDEGKSRVLNVGNDLNLNADFRVSSGFDLGDVYETRVLPDDEGYHANGDVGGVEGGRVSMSIDGVDGEVVVEGENLEGRSFELSELEKPGDDEKGGDGGIVVKNKDLGGIDFVSGEIAKGKSEASGTSGIEKVSEVVKGENWVGGEIVVTGKKSENRVFESSGIERGKSESPGIKGLEMCTKVGKDENDVGKVAGLGGGTKKKLSLSRRSDKGGETESEPRQKVVGEGEGLHVDGRHGDFKLERQGDSSVRPSKKNYGINSDGSVMRSVSAKVLGTEFEMGDMVWAKVKSHPWWPGHLYDEAFASSSVRRTRSDGHILVAFFGDSSYGWFDPDELIPYDPHYTDKCQQSTSRNFLRAVEESVDEASRRSALGLTCYCRNPYNFRPTDVQGYLAVDIVDFEPGTVYSLAQIKTARDSFRPTETLSFIHKLATAPMGSDSSKSLDFIKYKAAALAYRRSIFEEFDETYAEAFGHKPVRPQLPLASTVREPSRAPLSGPLVFGDSPGRRKSFTKATKPKDQSKKDRYLFKRRDESNDLRTKKISQGLASPSSSTFEDGTSDSTATGYVFQKRDHAASCNDLAESPAFDQSATSGYAVTSEDTYTTGRTLTSVLQHSESEAGDVRKVSDKTTAPSDSGNLLKKKEKREKKATKRPFSELSSEKPELTEKKIKKLKKRRSSENLESPSTQVQVSHFKKDDLAAESPQEVGSVALVENRENEADIRQLLSDLHGLALNPFHVVEKSGLTIARQFFLKFRSVVFLKSSSAAAIPELEHGADVADRFPAETNKGETTKDVASMKPKKLSVRQDDLTKGERKRILSERQEENAAKKAKKIKDVKSLTAEKKALMKNPEPQDSDGKSKILAPKSPQLKPVKKSERPVKVEEPTYLVMKFQSGSSLPSLVELKARFSRFGPLDTSLSRVFYKTNTCRVAFLFKQDAHVAYRYAVGNNSTFANVRFMLKPVAEPESQQPNPVPSLTESRPPTVAALPQPPQQLKSILKKPSVGDESAGPSNGGGGTRTPRVRFNIGDERRSASNNGALQVQMESRNEGAPLSSSSSSVAMDVNKNQRVLSLHPLERPLLPLPKSVRPPVNHQFQFSEIVSRNTFRENIATTSTASLPPPPPPPPPPPSVDISQEMICLLTRCHDVVTNLKSSFGYAPYHLL